MNVAEVDPGTNFFLVYHLKRQGDMVITRLMKLITPIENENYVFLVWYDNRYR